MEETKTIQIPKGWVVDKEKSTESSIVLVEAKEVPMRWRDNEDNHISGYWIGANSDLEYVENYQNDYNNHNIFVTLKQAKSTLAMARISQIMENDKRFGGVVTDEEWKVNNGIMKYAISRFGDDILIDSYYHKYHFLSFYTYQQAKLFLEENEDLVKQYLMIE